VKCATTPRPPTAYTARPEAPTDQPGRAEKPLDDFARLLGHVHGDRPDLLEVFTGLYRPDGRLSMPESRFYRPDQLDEALTWIGLMDSRNRECYFGTAQLLAPKRDKANVAPVLAGWADLDADQLDRCRVRPTAVVESSPGHFHPYWRYSRPVQAQKAEELNRRLALHIGADKSGWDLGQVLRVPGTHNRKRGEPTEVKLLYIDEDRTVDPDELDRMLPKLPEPPRPVGLPTEPLSTDDEELVAALRRRSALFDRLWNGDIRNYVKADGRPAESEADWAMIQELLRACAGDQERVERLMRCSGRAQARLDKWDEPRLGGTWLGYTIARAAQQPSAPQNATGYRSDDPTTWPEHAAPALDGPSNGHCSEHCRRRHHPVERSLRRQLDLQNKLIQTDYTEAVKIALLRTATVVGFHLEHGAEEVKLTAVGLGGSIKVSDQLVRQVWHALARRDRGKLVRPDGLFDLKTDRKPVGDNVTEPEHWESAFKMTPTFERAPGESAYNALLEQILGYDLKLPRKEKKPRKKLEPVAPPPEVVQIACPEHRVEGRPVVCAGCGEVLIKQVLYLPPLPQNATGYRPEPRPPSVGTLALPVSVLAPEGASTNGHAGAEEMLDGGLPWR
jgi:hypothetical protein